jgi:UDP:flavonoid glycosyltransferase YjiC (YdhE family)
MRILLFPSDLGGGFGHISRCLAVAEKGTARGHDCAFVLNDGKYAERVEKEFRVHVCKRKGSGNAFYRSLKDRFLTPKSRGGSIFTEISGLDFQVIRDGFVGEGTIKRKVGEYLRLVKEFKPDVLVGDTNLIVWMLGKQAHIPVVQIVRYATHPKTGELFWWKKVPEGIVAPDSSKVFNPVLEKMGLAPVSRAEDLLQGDLYIVPSIPEVEPVPEDQQTVHVGELTVSMNHKETGFWLEENEAREPMVYVTIGGGAGSVGNKDFFSTVAEAFRGKAVQVVVSTSNRFDPGAFACKASNIRFLEWVPGKALISKADLVIFHGGYGTMMEAIGLGKRTITVPFQSEQEGNGRRLEQLGCSVVMKLSKGKYHRVEGKWKHGRYSFLVQKTYDLDPQELYREVDKMLSNHKALDRARTLQSRITRYDGPGETLERIEKCYA